MVKHVGMEIENEMQDVDDDYIITIRWKGYDTRQEIFSISKGGDFGLMDSSDMRDLARALTYYAAKLMEEANQKEEDEHDKNYWDRLEKAD
jgi:hypothetical protein